MASLRDMIATIRGKRAAEEQAEIDRRLAQVTDEQRRKSALLKELLLQLQGQLVDHLFDDKLRLSVTPEMLEITKGTGQELVRKINLRLQSSAESRPFQAEIWMLFDDEFRIGMTDRTLLSENFIPEGKTKLTTVDDAVEGVKLFVAYCVRVHRL